MEINTLTVSELRKGLLKKDFTPKEILDSTIKKIEILDPKLNAFPIRCFDKAYKQLKKLPNIKEVNFFDYPLFGIPVGVKDLNDIEGVPTTQGSDLFKNYIAKEDDNIVSKVALN